MFKKDPIKKIKILRFILSIVALLFIFFLGFSLGVSKNLPTKYELVNKEAKTEKIDFSLFWKVWDYLHNNYLRTLNDKELFYSSIKGLVAGAKDPYSSFLTPKETSIFTEDMEEEFFGVGIEISAQDSKIIIIAPLKDSPAEKAGLKSQDQILAVDQKSTEGASLLEVVSWIRGKQGTEVELLIKRNGWSEPKKFKIRRYKISVESVKTKISDNLAYIQIHQFSEKTYSLVERFAQEILSKKPKGIILDLRQNPGGYFQAAVDITSLFIEKGVIVYEKGKSGQKRAYKTNKDPILKDFKVVILIDNGSASASEIIAGAFKDYGRATLIGEKTFGKGVMQVWETFSDGSSLVLTTAFWLTPKKQEIDKKGIEPDIILQSEKKDCSLKDQVCQKARELL